MWGFNKLPAYQRIYLACVYKGITGTKGVAITEKFFTKAELLQFRLLLDKRKAQYNPQTGVYSIDDYSQYAGFDSKMSKILGRFEFVDLVGDRYNILDMYDFNEPQPVSIQELIHEAKVDMANEGAVQGLANALGGVFLSQGKGVPVNIVIPPLSDLK